MHRLIGTVLQEAGLPAGVVNVISNAPEDAAAVVERLIVHPAVRRVNFTEKIRSLRAGKPGEEGAALAAMVDAEAAERVAEMVRDAIAKGALATTGGCSVDGSIMQPAIIDGVKPEMLLYQEESFGPVVTVLRVASDEEAVRLANDSEYGLSAAAFSRDFPRAMAVAQRIQSGICHINSSTVADEAQMPFGGVRGSGYGRFGGKAAIAEFTDLRWITIQRTPRHYPV